MCVWTAGTETIREAIAEPQALSVVSLVALRDLKDLDTEAKKPRLGVVKVLWVPEEELSEGVEKEEEKVVAAIVAEVEMIVSFSRKGGQAI